MSYNAQLLASMIKYEQKGQDIICSECKQKIDSISTSNYYTVQKNKMQHSVIAGHLVLGVNYTQNQYDVLIAGLTTLETNFNNAKQ